MAHDLFIDFRFEAAHRLPQVPEGHKCARLHGHSYKVTIGLRGEIDAARGWVIDFGEVEAAFEPLRARLDHYYLNEIEGLENPTAENLAVWIYTRMKAALVLVTEVTVAETCEARCVYRG